MDFSAVIAAHRKKALERIAARDKTSLPSEDVATSKPAPSGVSIDTIIEYLNTSPTPPQAPQEMPLQSMNTERQTHHTVATSFPGQTAGHKREMSPVDSLEAPMSKTRKFGRDVSERSSKLRLATVVDTNTSTTRLLEDKNSSCFSHGTEDDPIDIDTYEKPSETILVPKSPSMATPVERPVTRVALTSINVNQKATPVIRISRKQEQELTDGGIVKPDTHKTKAVGTPLKVKQEFGNLGLDSLPSQDRVPQISHSRDESEDELDTEVLKLLSYVSGKDEVASGQNESTSQAQLAEYKTAPLFSRAVSSFLDTSRPIGSSSSSTFSQYGLLGMYESTGMQEAYGIMRHAGVLKPSKDRLLFANMDAPWSAFICGSQGAGKSHTLSCLLETGLVQHSDLNKLPNPLSSIVFHYDKFSGKSSTQLCEAAFLCSSGNIPVTVLVSPSNVWNLKEMYTNLPGLPATSPRPQVKPLYLSDKHLTTATIMKLMCTDKHGEAPLYVAIVHTILQEMAMQGQGTGNFSYTDFRRRIDQHNWLKGQKGPLEMRLKLLESFLEPSGFTRTTRPAPSEEDIWTFKPGTLTIVDLSDSFIDENDACALFSMCLTIFMESRNKAGQIICLDEAHKFLTQSGEAQALTESLTSIIRQQRHTGTRVIIATQEPTLSPVLMDLANVTIVHRFLSPAWYKTIKQHLAGANKYDGTKSDSLFETIVNLATGEALLFCPTALLTVSSSARNKAVSRLGNDYARIRIRKRQGADGGRSIMASDASDNAAAAIAVDVPMFIVTRPPTPPRQYGRQPRNARNQSYRPAGQTYNNQSVSPQTPQFESITHSFPTTIPNPVALQNSSIVANAQAARDAGQPVTFSHIQQAVKNYVSQQFANHGWKAPANIGWEKVFKQVELVCVMRTGSIANSSLHREICRRAGIDQVNDCREAKGWSRI